MEVTFYQLAHEEFLKLNESLSDAELRVYLYLVTLNPFPERQFQIDAATISEKLGLVKRTIQRAVKRLGELKLIGIETSRLVKAFHGVCSRLKACVKGGDPQVHEDDPRVQSCDRKRHESDPKRHDSDRKQHIEEVKPLQSKASDTSNTNKTYSDFIHTLSDSTRESFEKFVREEWRKLTAKNGEPGQEIVSIERFLSKAEDFTNWYERFKSSAAGRNAAQQAANASADWHSKPYFEEWVRQAFHRGYEWVNEDSSEQKERLAFFTWADKANPYIGICYELPS